MTPKKHPIPVSSVPDPDDQILDLAGAARLLGFSVAHTSNIFNGKLDGLPAPPHVKAGRSIRIRRGTLMKWFSEQEQASARRSA